MEDFYKQCNELEAQLRKDLDKAYELMDGCRFLPTHEDDQRYFYEFLVKCHDHLLEAVEAMENM